MTSNDHIAASIDTLRTLVGFNTVSDRSNQALIDWVANRLADCGVRAEVQHGHEAGKANLFATIGPQDRPGVMLSGHSDVVPVAGERWLSDPFTLTERDGRLHGRGSADMKGFIACFTALAPHFVAADLRTPIHLALSYNEETDMSGMRHLVRHLEQAPVLPASCVIGEPTGMRMVVANKGAAIYRCHVKGHPVHSSLRDQGVSAVELAAELIVFINSMQRRLNTAEEHEGFDFAHSSVHVGEIRGGTAHNITAADCEFVFEIRALPGVRAAHLVAEIRQYADQVLLAPWRARFAAVGITITEVVDAPGLDERGNQRLADALKPLCRHEGFGRVSFGTEAGMLQEAGIPTVVLGPGQIGVAHQADEYVEIDQLAQCLDFMDQLSARLSRDGWQ